VPYAFYKVAHLVGIIVLFLSLGVALAGSAASGRDGAAQAPLARVASIAHGVALLVVLVAGFGLLARLGLSVAQPWVAAKLVIWFALGGALTLVKRKPELSKVLFVVLPLCGGLAAWLALQKPGTSAPSPAPPPAEPP
jgi:hypothetical protein